MLAMVCFQRQILAGDVGLRAGIRVDGQQRLRVGIEVLDFLDDELGPGLHHLLDGAPVDRTQNAQPVLGRNVRRQLDLDLESLLVAVFRIDDVVLRQADVLGRDIARVAVELDEVGRAQGRRGQKVIERPRRRAVALVADRLIGDDREVVELGFLTKLVEKIDLDFHAGIQKRRLLIGISGVAWTRAPSLGMALLVGVCTVAFPLLVMQPAMGLGVAASKTPSPIKNCIRSLINHSVFGLGLFLSACVIEWISR
jgi:hypothetical protein